MLQKVISGGQTGADIAALRAARACDLATGGYVPYTFPRALIDQYGLVAVSWHGARETLVWRSQRNVDAADATVAFSLHPSPGTDCTVAYARTGVWARMPVQAGETGGRRPTLVVTRLEPRGEVAAAVRAFVRRFATVNVCGNRDADEAAVEAVLAEAFRNE